MQNRHFMVVYSASTFPPVIAVRFLMKRRFIMPLGYF